MTKLGGFDEPLEPAPAPEPEAPVPAAPAGPQKLIGPDGLAYTVPPESVETALKNGWRTAESIDEEKAAAHEQAIQNRLATKENERGWGAWHRFGNEALAGVPDLVDEYKNAQSPFGQEENAVEHEAEERFTKEHKAEAYGEKAAGFAASLLLTGGVGTAGAMVERTVLEGAEQTLARKVAASAAKVAAEGAIYASPQAAVQATYGDPERAAETMLWGIGLGAVLGGGGKLAGAGAKAVAEGGSAKIADILSHKQPDGVSVLDRVAGDIFGIKGSQAKRLGADGMARVVEAGDREGLLALDPAKRVAAIEAAQEDAGSKIGAYRMEADELVATDKKFTDMAPKAHVAAADIEKAIYEQNPALHTPIHRANASYANDILDTVRSYAGKDTFESLQAAREAIRSKKSDALKKSVQAEITDLADEYVKKHMDDAMQRIFESGGMKDKFADYMVQKERYWAMGQLLQAAEAQKPSGILPHGLGGFGDMMRLSAHASVGSPGTGLLHIAGHHALKAFTSNKWGLFGKSVSFLRGAAKDPAALPFIGGLMAKEGTEALTSHIETLPGVLSGAKKVAGHTAKDVGKDYVEDLIGPTTGLTKQQQYDRLVATITQASVDSSVTADRVGHVANMFSGTNVQLASLVAQKKLNAIAYLQSQIPKNPNPARAFQENNWRPSPQQRRDFMAKVEIASNPMVVWQHYQEGRLTKVDRDTLMAVYPRIYQEMVAKIEAESRNPRGPKLAGDKVAQLDMFTGGMLGSARNLPAIQQALTAQQQQQPQPGPRPSSRPKLKTPGVGTDTQRRTAGGAVH